MREEPSLLEFFRAGTSSSEAQGSDKIKTPFASPCLGGEKATTMMVYRMKAQPQLLQQSLPKDDLETLEQW